jgi:hypothetical protein
MKLPHRRGSVGALPVLMGLLSPSLARGNASLITGLNDPYGIALSGTDVFVTNLGRNTAGEYTAAGATVNASLTSGLIHPAGSAVAPPVWREEQRTI